MNVKRRWKIAIVGAALIAIVATLVLTTPDSEPEPIYNGHTLSEWISDCAPEDGPLNVRDAATTEGARALRAMTPQIFPTLIRWISYERSPSLATMQDIVCAIAERIGAGEKCYALVQRRHNRMVAAFEAFDALGTNAAPAIPQLSKMVMDANHPAAADHALQAMASMGEKGTDSILSLLHNPNNPNLSATLASLTLCSDRSSDVIREQIKPFLTNHDGQIRAAATNALEELAMLPQPAVPPQ
ncbi:MAG: hypothetical protein ACXWKG_10980 [Limisphaerales bacterium]